MKTLSPTKTHVLVKTWIERNTDGAYEDLYNYLYEPVTKIVNIFIKNSAKTEDVTNDIFIRIYKLEKDVLPNKNELSWIYKMVKNYCIEYLTKHDPNFVFDNCLIVTDTDEYNVDYIDRLDFNNMLIGATPEQKEIVALKILGDFNFKDISNFLPMPVRKVKSNYYICFSIVKLLSVTALISAVAFLTFILKMKTGTYDGEVTNISTFFAKYQTIGYFLGFIIFLVLTFMLYIRFLKKPRKLIKG